MKFNILTRKHIPCLLRIVKLNTMVTVIAELKICAVKSLIFTYMSKKRNKVPLFCLEAMAVYPFYIAEQLFSNLIRKIIDISKICVESSAVQPCLAAYIRNGDAVDLTVFQKLEKNRFNFLNAPPPSFVVYRVNLCSPAFTVLKLTISHLFSKNKGTKPIQRGINIDKTGFSSYNITDYSKHPKGAQPYAA